MPQVVPRILAHKLHAGRQVDKGHRQRFTGSEFRSPHRESYLKRLNGQLGQPHSVIISPTGHGWISPTSTRNRWPWAVACNLHLGTAPQVTQLLCQEADSEQ